MFPDGARRREAELLRRQDAKRREEAGDALGAGLAVRHGLGRDVGQRAAGVGARAAEEREGGQEGAPDAEAVADHAAEPEAERHAEHDAALQPAEEGGALERRRHLAGDGVDDQPAGASAPMPAKRGGGGTYT